jgi:UDP-glucose 4-epimerase
MRVLVTGCAGFLGFHLCEALTRKPGYVVVGMDNLLKNNVDVQFEDLCNKSNFSFKKLDLCRPLHEGIEKCDFDLIYHLAALNGTQEFYNRPWDVLKNSTLPNLNIIEFAQMATKPVKIIYASTSEIYAGSVSQGLSSVPTNETAQALIEDVENVRWSYAVGKLTGEVALVAAAKQTRAEYTIIRYHNAYGPRMGINHVIPDYINRAMKGVYSLYGASNTRSFMYVDDVVSDTIALGENANVKNQIVNIGSNEEITMLDLAHKINSLMGISADVEIFDAPKGSVSRRCPDVSKIDKLLGAQKRTSLEDGLKKTISYYRENSNV